MANEVVLRIGYADGRLEERAFIPGTYRVGRESGDLVLGGDPKVSASHAELVVAAEQVTITDLGSRNGILDRGGTRLTRAHRLAFDQPLILGRSSLTLVRGVACAGRTEAVTEMGDASPPGKRAPHSAPTGPRRHQPSITGARLEEARGELKFWRLLVRALGVAFAVTLGFAICSLSTGDESTVLLGGMTTVASGGMLAWLLKRREEAQAEYDRAELRAVMGTDEIGKRHREPVGNASGTSAWTYYRALPPLAQAVILFYAWWLVIPLWLLSSGKKELERGA